MKKIQTVMTKSVVREATKDAQEYAFAEMFFGEGAGIRRKLIGHTVEFKSQNSPAYATAFSAAMAKQDWADVAKRAKRQRRRVDGIKTLEKSTKAVARGDFLQAHAGFLILGGAIYVAHETGYDKVIIAKTKTTYRNLKTKLERKSASVHNITNVNN